MFCSFKARQVFDSRGRPTIEALVNGFSGLAPSGASTGKHELSEKRAKNGFLAQVKAINGLKPAEFSSLNVFDAFIASLNLGSSASTALSFAAARTFAAERGVPLWGFLGILSRQMPRLPFVQFNLINGGKHAGLENDVQEHMFVAKGKTMRQRVEAGASVFQELKAILHKKYGSPAVLVGDEGGFVPPVSKVEDRLALISKACQNAGEDCVLGLDAAATEFFDGKKYKIGKKLFSKEKLVDYYEALSQNFVIDSVEDGFAEDDWQGWSLLMEALGKKMLVVGDDLLVTNAERVRLAVENHACNAMIVKPNQVGSVTAATAAARLARKHGFKLVVSHRSGETEDSFIAHLAVGLGADYVKFGAPCRSERLAKYNELLRIGEAF